MKSTSRSSPESGFDLDGGIAGTGAESLAMAEHATDAACERPVPPDPGKVLAGAVFGPGVVSPRPVNILASQEAPAKTMARSVKPTKDRLAARAIQTANTARAQRTAPDANMAQLARMSPGVNATQAAGMAPDATVIQAVVPEVAELQFESSKESPAFGPGIPLSPAEILKAVLDAGKSRTLKPRVENEAGLRLMSEPDPEKARVLQTAMAAKAAQEALAAKATQAIKAANDQAAKVPQAIQAVRAQTAKAVQAARYQTGQIPQASQAARHPAGYASQAAPEPKAFQVANEAQAVKALQDIQTARVQAIQEAGAAQALKVASDQAAKARQEAQAAKAAQAIQVVRAQVAKAGQEAQAVKAAQAAKAGQEGQAAKPDQEGQAVNPQAAQAENIQAVQAAQRGQSAQVLEPQSSQGPQAAKTPRAQATQPVHAQEAALAAQAVLAARAQVAQAIRAPENYSPGQSGDRKAPNKAKSYFMSFLRALPIGAVLLILAALLAASVIYAIQLAKEPAAAVDSANRQIIPLTPPPPYKPALDKKLLADLVGPRKLPAEGGGFMAIEAPEGREFFARTTLDAELQAKALQWVGQAGGVRVALVAIDPMTGRVLALAGTEVDGANSALSGTYPAASVFKMVTAVAALEKGGVSGDSVIKYDGSKHTLYKSNVVKGVGEGIHKSTLRTSFAESVNSVFGKLGAHEIGGAGLADAADRFGFNRELDFEMPLEASVFDLGTAGPADPGVPAGDSEDGSPTGILAAVKTEPAQAEAEAPNGQASSGDIAGAVPEPSPDRAEEIFHLAELASGFNRVTKISPVHGALMAATAINGGTLFEPTVISEVFDKQNDILYQSVPVPIGAALGEAAASELRAMMTAAVHEGTGRKHFSDAFDHRILSKLELGGKSGSINDETGSRVDWFVAFAKPKDPDSDVPPLALASVVVHQGNARMASQELIRRALLTFYGSKFTATSAVEPEVIQSQDNS